MSTITVCNDSVTKVDAVDKLVACTNWPDLMKGALVEAAQKGDSDIARQLEQKPKINIAI